MRRFFATCLLAWAAVAAADMLPIETMFKRPQHFGATLSPHGNYVAVVGKTANDRYNVIVIDLGTRRGKAITDFAQGDVTRVLWQSEDRLVVFVGDVHRGTGEPPQERGVVAIDRDGRNATTLLGFGIPDFVHTMDGDEILLAGAGNGGRPGRDVYRVNTRTGDQTLLTFESPGKVTTWIVDLDGVPRAAIVADREFDRSAWYVRKTASDAWQVVEEGPLGLLQSSPIAFDPDGKTLYVLSRRNSDRAALYAFDVPSRTWEGPILRHVERDIHGAFFSDLVLRKFIGIQYQDDKPSFLWFERDWVKMQKSVDAALPNRTNYLDKGGDRWLVVSRSDREPGEVYLLDGKTMKMEKLLSYRPWINASDMAATRWVRYRARDGLSVPALLTLPKNRPTKGLPLIVDIRSSPFSWPNDWQFQPVVQFLASRGYAVLQPQPRGTRGFGWKFHSAGFRQIGEGIQDDIEDGVKWALAEGLADPGRVAFYGYGYGGLAAMLGTMRTPKLISCAVVRSGVATVDWLFVNARRLDDTTARAEMIGTDRARLRASSPLEHPEKIGVPVLLAYGSYDTELHGVDLKSALRANDKPHEWVLYDEEGGFGFRRDENVFDYYHRVERFLGQCMQRSPEAPSKTTLP
jgi:dipeptidyl aminopeptidase/acylaminoacyl peptidase